jgi:hypothetical protein
VLLFAVVGAVALHHGLPMTGGDHHGMDMGAVTELCLGVFTAVGAAVVAVALGVVDLGRRRSPAMLQTAIAQPVAPRALPRARAGPAFLCVSRR